jgi:predicted MFS family arabinose efflux permease
MRARADGSIAPIFFLFCAQLGFDEVRTGVLLTCITLGDLAVTLALSTRADALGRRRVLIAGAALKVLAGAAFARARSFEALLAAGVVGVLSTSGGEVGPFLAIEQAALTDAVLACQRAASSPAPARGATSGDVAVLFGYYNAVGYWAQAAGAAAAGAAVTLLQRPSARGARAGWPPLDAYRAVFYAYAASGALMAAAYAALSPAAEAPRAPPPAAGSSSSTGAGATRAPRSLLGLRRPGSARNVARLSAFFALDAFAGGFTMQAFVAFWFAQRWGLSPARIGALLSASNIVAGASGVAAAYLVARWGAMTTMIVTHLPSNILLIAVPFMRSPRGAAAMLVARFCISQMDVPARHAYVATVVAPDERAAAGGITNVVRSAGGAAAPLLLGYLAAAQPRDGMLFAAPWLISGGVKIVYDIGLYGMYRCGSRMRSDEVGAEAASHGSQREAAAGEDAATSAAEGLRAPLLGGGAQRDEDEECAL